MTQRGWGQLAFTAQQTTPKCVAPNNSLDLVHDSVSWADLGGPYSRVCRQQGSWILTGDPGWLLAGL